MDAVVLGFGLSSSNGNWLSTLRWGDFRYNDVSPAPTMDMMCASMQKNVTYLLSILNVMLQVFHLLLFTDLL